MKIAKSMNIGLHPVIARRDIFVTCCDNFLIDAQGNVERLHKTPHEIVELG